MKLITYSLTFLCLTLLSLNGCGNNLGPAVVNPNFPSLGDTGLQPSTSVDINSQGQVIDIAPSIEDNAASGITDLSGAVGTFAEQSVETVICVILDGEGGNVDLAVCDADSANRETRSADKVCPDVIGASHCVSVVTSREPDFCTVTGARDYVFSIINRTPNEVRAAYQVVDVTTLPNQSCEDLNITEDSIIADTQ